MSIQGGLAGRGRHQRRKIVKSKLSTMLIMMQVTIGK
jgi:hypothetical protein